MSDTLDQIKSEDKIYKDKFFWLATFLGGPLVAGYLFAENFKVFGETEKVKPTWIIAIIITIVVFTISFLIPEDINFPNQIIPITYTATAISLFKKYQDENAIAHINQGGLIYSWWRVIGISIAGALITLSIVFGVIYALDTVEQQNVTTKTYGKSIQNEIDFDNTNISEQEIDNLALAFEQIGFFNASFPIYLHVVKNGNIYEIFISAAEGVENNTQDLKIYTEYRDLLSAKFPDNEIEFKLVVNYLDNVVKVIK